MKDSDSFNFVFYTLWGSLLLSPPAAFFSARYAHQHRYMPHSLNSFGAFFLIGLACLFVGIQFSSTQANSVVLAVIYFSFFFIVGYASKSGALYLKIPALLSGACVASIGYLLGTGGVLALAFIVGDAIPVHSAVASPNVRCSVTTYGNATTSTGGYVVQLQRPLLSSFVLITLDEQRFEQSQSQVSVSPQEACTLAVEKNFS